MLKLLATTCLLPPLLPVLVTLLGLLLRWRRQRRLGLLLVVSGPLLLLLLATPVCAGWLLRSLQTSPALPAAGPLPPAEAIVVLSAEADRDGTEFGGPVAGALTLQRLRYAAALHRRTGLPVLCSGGVPAIGQPPLAATMAADLQRDFATPVRWQEGRSADTFENARFSAELLRAAAVHRVLLVTHAWHMPRAAGAFAACGLEVVPAPTAFRGPTRAGLEAWLPCWPALRDSGLALHELIGLLYYRLTG